MELNRGKPPMIEVAHLSRSYGPVVAVDDVSLRIERGEVIGLLGHNGAGKTTIMKMMAGYLEPTAGTIRIDELEIGKDTRAIQARIGYLPENCPVWPEMMVVDYLDYQASLHQVPRAKRGRAIAASLRRTELQEKAMQPIHTLSRGYRQRVGVAQALLHEPDIVILDEPTNGLDPAQIQHMRGLIRELARTATVIVSTHVLQEVQAVCERVLILRAGKLALDARLADLQSSRCLLVSVDGEAREPLERVAGVAAVTARAPANGRRDYLLDAPEEIGPAVASAVLAAGLRLYALRPERRDLETVFHEVNDGGIAAGHD